MKLSELQARVDALIRERGDGACAYFLFTEKEVTDLDPELPAAEILEEFQANHGNPPHDDYLWGQLVELTRLWER